MSEGTQSDPSPHLPSPSPNPTPRQCNASFDCGSEMTYHCTDVWRRTRGLRKRVDRPQVFLRPCKRILKSDDHISAMVLRIRGTDTCRRRILGQWCCCMFRVIRKLSRKLFRTSGALRGAFEYTIPRESKHQRKIVGSGTLRGIYVGYHFP